MSDQKAILVNAILDGWNTFAKISDLPTCKKINNKTWRKIQGRMRAEPGFIDSLPEKWGLIAAHLKKNEWGAPLDLQQCCRSTVYLMARAKAGLK